MKIFVAQIKSLAGDITGNAARIKYAYKQAIKEDCDVCLLPELATSGYLAEDLFLNPDFLAAISKINNDLIKNTKNCALILPTVSVIARSAKRDAAIPSLMGSSRRFAPQDDGCGLTPPQDDGAGFRDDSYPKLYNGVIVAQNGKIIGNTQKAILPNHGVFDDKRYFTPGTSQIITINGLKVGIPICEDIWHFEVCNELKSKGAEIFLVPNASPFELGKFELRTQQIIARYNEHKIPLVFCNQATSQDGIIFDGNSFCYDGKLSVICDGFCEDSAVVVFEKGHLEEREARRQDQGSASILSKARDPARKIQVLDASFPHLNTKESDFRTGSLALLRIDARASIPKIQSSRCFAPQDDCSLTQYNNSTIYQAITFGLKSYTHDNGFKQIILGLSGGIDSALVACICADSLGPENVTAYMLPSKLTSQSSKDDALELAKLLGINISEIPITTILESNIKELGLQQNAVKEDLTYQNLQARIRGTILMAQANKEGSLLITTGNKSEYATGYATIYGDMNGAFNPIKDLYKTQIFALSRWRNSVSPVIPENIITKAPSAELSTNQKDSDSLPEYEILDQILYSYIELRASKEELYQTFDSNIVNKIITLVRKSEFKRKQSAPGVKISIRNLEKDRRFPITNLFD